MSLMAQSLRYSQNLHDGGQNMAYITAYITHILLLSVQSHALNRCISVANTLNKTSVRHGHFTSVHTTLINQCEYIHKYINYIYLRGSTAFLYRFFISSGYILRYISWYIPPCKPLVVYVSGYTMIKCVLYTCIYPSIYFIYI